MPNSDFQDSFVHLYLRAATIQLLRNTIHIAIFMSRYDTYHDTFSGMRKAF